MANNAVTLACSLATNGLPVNVGNSGTWNGAFTDGDTSLDTTVSVGTSSTTLHADIGGDGIVMVSNPSTIAGVANTVSVSLFAMTQALGPVPPGMVIPVPVSNGVQIKATVPSGTLLVGVTVIECDPNA